MKKLISVIMTMIMVMSMGTIGFAENNETYKTNEIQSYSDDIQTRGDGVTSWKVVSKDKVGTVKGAWQTGPEHRGPVIDTLKYKKSVKAEISGSYTSISIIYAALNIAITGYVEVSREIKLIVPNGVTHKYSFAILYDRYKVTEKEYYRIDGHDTYTGKSKISYVNKPVDVATTYTTL